MNKEKRTYLRLLLFLLLILLAFFIWWGYDQTWTGFNYAPETPGYRPTKLLWDWLELLIVPIVLTLLGLLFNYTQKRTEIEIASKKEIHEREIEDDKNQEATLRQYLEQMNDLVFNKGLTSPTPTANVLGIARIITLTTLRRINSERAGVILRYLYEAKLLDADDLKVDISGIRLRKIKLWKQIDKINFQGVEFHESDFTGCELSNCNLNNSKFYRCNFRNANLINSSVEKTEFTMSDLTRANLSGVNGRHTDFSYSILIETKFNNAILQESEFFQTELFRTRFCDADLTSAIFANTILDHVNFIGATMDPINPHMVNIINSPPLEDSFSGQISRLENKHNQKDGLFKNFIMRIKNFSFRKKIM